MYSDEYLDYWGQVYTACRLSEPGIVFHEFLADPWRHLCELGLQSAPVSLELGYRPLLPRQAKVAQALWKRWEAEDQDKPSGSVLPTEREELPPVMQPVRQFLYPALAPSVLAFPRILRKSKPPGA
ncbi:MAG: hypothetical protein ACYC9L_11230 [Sulfuricaulis sp.]